MRGRLLLALAALLLGGCTTLSHTQRDESAGIAQAARSTQVDCTASDACALDTPLRELATRAFAESTPSAPRHYALILDQAAEFSLREDRVAPEAECDTIAQIDMKVESHPPSRVGLAQCGSGAVQHAHVIHFGADEFFGSQ